MIPYGSLQVSRQMDFVPLHFYDRKVQIPILPWHIWLISDWKAAGIWGSVMKFQSPILLIVKYEGSILVWQFLFTQLSIFYILDFELCYRAFVLMPVIQIQRQNLEHCGQIGREGPENMYTDLFFRAREAQQTAMDTTCIRSLKWTNTISFDTKVISQDKGPLRKWCDIWVDRSVLGQYIEWT